MIHEAFHSEQIHALPGKPITRNVVRINNGKGFKLHETLNANGKTLRKTRKNLNAKEIHHIMNRRFLPGLWHGVEKRGLQSRKKSNDKSRR